MSRPELTGHASTFYNAREARKYDSSSRMVGVQREITERAIELLRLPPSSDKPCFVLDVGCGSGLSGRVLEEAGHAWVGCDVSRDMLDVAGERIREAAAARRRRRVGRRNGRGDEDEEEEEQMDEEDDESSEDDEEDMNVDGERGGGKSERLHSVGDLLHHDMGTGLPFRPATFDGCISISALQWLCYSNAKDQIPKRRLIRFFSSLYEVLRRGARAVLQFYPETAEQAILISECAAKVGFAGGVVVDYPNSAKAKKHYLVLSFDRTYKAPAGLTDGALLSGVRVDNDAAGSSRKKGGKGKQQLHRKKKGVKTKEWILQKKEMQRKKGKEVRSDTRFTGRKRRDRF